MAKVGAHGGEPGLQRILSAWWATELKRAQVGSPGFGGAAIST